MKISVIRKNTYFFGVHTLKYVFVFRKHCLLITFKTGHIDSLGISESVHYKNNFLLNKLRLLINSCRRILYDRETWHLIFFLDLFKIFLNSLLHCLTASQYILVSGNLKKCLLVFFLQSFYFESDQFVKTEFKNCSRLSLCKMKFGSIIPGLL